HQTQRQLILRDRHDGAADEGAREIELQAQHHQQRDEARDQHAQRQVDEGEAQRRPDVDRLDVAVIDAEHQDETDLGDEQQAEEERQPAQRFLAAPLERGVIDLIDRAAQHVERRQHDQADEDRVDAEIGVDDVGDVRAQDDERRVRDIDDVENAERDRDYRGHGGIEAAEKEPGHDGVGRNSTGMYNGKPAVL